MPNYKLAGIGIVRWLGIGTGNDSHSVSRISKDAVVCLVGTGLSGDRHAGSTRLSDVREDVLRVIGVGKEVPIANVRQFSMVSHEELLAIWQAMGTKGELPVYGLLGENIVVCDIGAISKSPPGSLITFSREKGSTKQDSKAVLAIWGENNPCKIPHQDINNHYHDDNNHLKPFAMAAKDLRGVVGFVYCSGKIKLGDQVSFWHPLT